MGKPAYYLVAHMKGQSFEDAKASVAAALKDQGFGVLTEIDMQATLKVKIGADIRRYTILGACNPPFAHRAVTEEAHIGLLLPCNVLLQEEGDGTIVVSAINPVVSMQAVDNPALQPLAEEVKGQLEKALKSLSAA